MLTCKFLLGVELVLPKSVVISTTSNPLDLKYARASFREMDGEGRSTAAASDFMPSFRPVKTG